MNERSEQGMLSRLGLCVRAGKVLFGVPQICEAMRSGKNPPLVVFEAADTSENTHKRITDKCQYYNVTQIRLSCDGETLAAALGKSAVLGAIAVTDQRMCDMVLQEKDKRQPKT